MVGRIYDLLKQAEALSFPLPAHNMTTHKRKRAEEPVDSDNYFSEVEQDDDDDFDVDISSALTGKKPRTGPRPPRAAAPAGGDDDEDIEELIKESIAKRNVKGGTELLKKTKGKTKITKGEVGGGSFQSMGAFSQHRINCTLFMFRRLASLAIAVSHSAGFPDTHTHPATFYPCPLDESSTRPRWNGADRFWKVFGISCPFGPEAWRKTLHGLRCTRLDPASCS